MNQNLKGNKEYIKNLLINKLSENQVEVLFKYISNPAKYPQIVNLLKGFRNEFLGKNESFSPSEYTAVCNWLDDELAFAILIIQNSKCDPFKFINCKSKY